MSSCDLKVGDKMIRRFWDDEYPDEIVRVTKTYAVTKSGFKIKKHVDKYRAKDATFTTWIKKGGKNE